MVRGHFSYEPARGGVLPTGGIMNGAGSGLIPVCDPNATAAKTRDCIAPPRPIHTPEPEFSEEARKAGTQGTVMLSVVVGADGRVQSACALQSLGDGLGEKAVETVRQWKFEAATHDGNPVPAQIMVEVDFHLAPGSAGVVASAMESKAMPLVDNTASQSSDSGSQTKGAKDDQTVYRGRGVTPPRVIYHPDPEFSEQARRKKVEGVVVLKLTVTSKGEVADVKVVSGPGKAIEAVRQWKFTPGTKEGRPVWTEVAVEVSFHRYK